MPSFNRAHTPDQRGYVLISVLILAVLYLGLMELMLRDSSEALRSASRFRSRIIAQSLAEDGVELAASGIIGRAAAKISYEDDQGKITAEMKRHDDSFEITSHSITAGTARSSASVSVYGRIDGSRITVERTVHSQ